MRALYRELLHKDAGQLTRKAEVEEGSGREKREREEFIDNQEVTESR